MNDTDYTATEVEARLLRILADRCHGRGLRAREIAPHLYPETYRRVSNVGHGATRGVGATYATGRVCWSCYRKGWLRRDTLHSLNYWRLNAAGKAELAWWEEQAAEWAMETTR
jgi:hypothetical protein